MSKQTKQAKVNEVVHYFQKLEGEEVPLPVMILLAQGLVARLEELDRAATAEQVQPVRAQRIGEYPG